MFELNRSDAVAELESRLNERVSLFANSWGPIAWRVLAEDGQRPNEHEGLGRIFWALSNIEDESAYMRRQVSWIRADKLRAIDDFNSMWLGEELEHARSLGAIAAMLGHPPTRRNHSLAHRDRRSVLSALTARIGSLYPPGVLAAYLTLGAMQEHTALTTYNAVAHQELPDWVRTILKNISRQEGRHMGFYKKSALDVMELFPRSRAFARLIITKGWRPVGVDLLGVREWVDIFVPTLDGPEFCEKLSHVDKIASDLLQVDFRMMEQFLHTHTSGYAPTGSS